MVNRLIIRKIRNLPPKPGVYIFKNARGKILYIGKAANLKERVRSYFSSSFDTTPAKLRLVEEIRDIEIRKTPSAIEALVLESALIKKKRPKYNVVFKDDKNYFFVAITREGFPRIFITHQKKTIKNKNTKITYEYIGPFTDGASLKRVMRILRGIFPYYIAPHPKNRKCTYCHINLCPGPNPDKRAYRKSIRNIKSIIIGKRIGLIRQLKREMERTARNEEFERAATFRDQIDALENIVAHSFVVSSPIQRDTRITPARYDLRIDLARHLGIHMSPKNGVRIEGYDISNIQGQSATGSMVVFKGLNGTRPIPDTHEYRKFRIKLKGGANDVAMIKEVLTRRLRHPEWPLPDLILIDGGRAQLNAAMEIVRLYGPQAIKLLLVSLAKRDEEIYVPHCSSPIRLRRDSSLLHLFMYIRDEAHRFAIGYYRKLHRKQI